MSQSTSPTKSDLPQPLAAVDFSDAECAAIRVALLGWYRLYRRELPWRDIQDPYLIWVSEIMLQQTQVATVVAYYQRWAQRFPTVEALATASLDEVLEQWAGLGYYRRARFLHESSKTVLEEMGGRLPRSAGQLRKLKGVGPYTAGAIASIAFGQPEPLVDGNVERVLARLRAVRGDAKSGAFQKLWWRLAARVLDPEEPGDFNQALMELGATVCTPQNPNCEDCPVRGVCHASRTESPTDFPSPAKRTRQRPVRVRSLVVARELRAQNDGALTREFLLLKRPLDGIWGGLWECPSVEVSARAADSKVFGALQDFLASAAGLMLEDPTQLQRIGEFVHHFSHIKMQVEADYWDASGQKNAVGAPAARLHDASARPYKWVPEDALDAVAMSAAMRKILALYRARD
ncbi:A/G-specific adenine glycosylase [Bradymonas sediminis]|uniref:A/G-specific adenine glycosylase n=1 Tax=Bradymonas sediminis TaxID=1548548 RepID=UPI0010E80278|nr:A/G-specific adenine glycosylase [Bradymonas sediminis]TDP77353.1 A/G-specific DNA-adenine glycosylase [Bradymonas sediminis]